VLFSIDTDPRPHSYSPRAAPREDVSRILLDASTSPLASSRIRACTHALRLLHHRQAALSHTSCIGASLLSVDSWFGLMRLFRVSWAVHRSPRCRYEGPLDPVAHQYLSFFNTQYMPTARSAPRVGPSPAQATASVQRLTKPHIPTTRGAPFRDTRVMRPRDRSQYIQ
jgi:hypothetical protein